MLDDATRLKELDNLRVLDRKSRAILRESSPQREARSRTSLPISPRRVTVRLSSEYSYELLGRAAAPLYWPDGPDVAAERDKRISRSAVCLRATPISSRASLTRGRRSQLELSVSIAKAAAEASAAARNALRTSARCRARMRSESAGRFLGALLGALFLEGFLWFF